MEAAGRVVYGRIAELSVVVISLFSGSAYHTCQQASALARLAQLGVFDRAERAEREGLLSELREREYGRSLGQLARLG